MTSKTPSPKPKTKKQKSGPPPVDPVVDLKMSPEVVAYFEARNIPLPTCPPAVKTPEPRDLDGAFFDFERVDKVIAAFCALTHVAGKWAGQPFRPDPWQIAYYLAPVFGWVHWSDEADAYVRIIRDVYIDVPRKNGKSLLASGTAIYLACADGEQAAQVVTAATTKDQAKFVFQPINTLASRSPALKGHVVALAEKVIHKRSASTIQPVSSVADAQHGANIHGSVVDELHVHKSPDLVETIETGRGSRTQPLSLIITTADSGKPGTIYDRKRKYVDSLAAETISDPNTFGVVFAADRDDDPFSVETQKKANPGYGISPSASYLAAEALKAKNDPAQLAAYQRLHLGIRTKQTEKYITLDAFRANAGPGWVDGEFADRVAYGGLDLASTSDVTALCWLFPRPDDGFDALWRMWIPQLAFEKMNERTAGEATVWLANGWLTVTPGNVTDYEFVRQQINADAELFDVQTIAYDRWNASQLTIELQDDGFTMVKVGQGFASMSAPLKECKRLLLLGAERKRPMLRYGGNKVMEWMTDNLAVAEDAAGNVKPDKASAGDKIDGWSALVNAMSEAMLGVKKPQSAYKSNGLRVV